MQDATSLAGAIAAGAVSAPEVMEAALAAAGRHAGLGALAVVDAATGRAGAALPLPGPFLGIPFLGKDLGSGAAGLPPAAGSPALRRRTPGTGVESDLFQRFRAAGLVPFGLTTVPPFGLALTSDPARNPFDPALSPGGSSGGAAVAVAAGIVAIAHATDAAGSIRVPAACCGLVGLKPSRGVVPQGPDFGNHLMGLAAELVLARSVRDVAAALAAVAGPLPETPPLTRIAMVLPDRCETLQNQAVREVAGVLRGLGCGVLEYPAPDDLGGRAAGVARTVLTASLAEWMDAVGVPDEELPPLCAEVAGEGRAMPAARLFAASRELAVVTHLFWQRFSDVDVILSPVLSGPPPPVGAFNMAATDAGPHWAQMEALAPNAALANVTGAPAIAVPMGASGLPASVQLLSRPRTDTALLHLARRLQDALPPVSFPFPIAGHP